MESGKVKAAHLSKCLLIALERYNKLYKKPLKRVPNGLPAA